MSVCRRDAAFKPARMHSRRLTPRRPGYACQSLIGSDGHLLWTGKPDDWAAIRDEKAVPDLKQPIRFQGQWLDEETGLYYNRYRFYDPRQGRYITQDPIVLAGGINSYAYVANPTGWVDPLGLRQVGEYARPIRDVARDQLQGQLQDQLRKTRAPASFPAQRGDHAVYDSCTNNERIMECERRLEAWSVCYDVNKPYIGHPLHTLSNEAIIAFSYNTACRVQNLCSLIDENGTPISSDHPKHEIWLEKAPNCD